MASCWWFSRPNTRPGHLPFYPCCSSLASRKEGEKCEAVRSSFFNPHGMNVLPNSQLCLYWSLAALYIYILSMVQTNDPEPVWDKPTDVPEKWIQTVDDNVYASKSFLCDREPTKAQILTKAELPPGSKVKGIYPYGASYWTRTAEIQTEQADGRSSFLILLNSS